MRPPFEDKLKKDADLIDYNPSKHTPVFYGKMHEKVLSIDANVESELDASVSHPACVGHTFVDPAPPAPPKSLPTLPDRHECKF